MEVILATFVLFALSMLAMGLGVLLSGRLLRGSCGGPEVVTGDGEAISCGACPKKEREICPSDDPLVDLAQIANPNRKLDHHHG